MGAGKNVGCIFGYSARSNGCWRRGPRQQHAVVFTQMTTDHRATRQALSFCAPRPGTSVRAYRAIAGGTGRRLGRS
jgi:hypothetical protein